MAINLVFASFCVLRIWEYGEHPINYSDTYSCSCEKIICGVLSEHSASAVLFIYCLKEQLNHVCLVFSIWQKFREISRDFWFWWICNFLYCRISLCLLCNFDGIFEVAVCNQVNIWISFNWLYVAVMSRSRFRVNPHSIVACMSRKSLLETGAKSDD